MPRPRRVRPRLLIVPLTALALTTAGCGALSGDDSADDGELTVAASFYPLQYVTQTVAGDALDVESLTSPGVEPHDLELGVRESALIADADLLVYLDSMQPAVDDAVAESATGTTLDAATVVDLVAYADREHDHEDHADEHAEDEHADEEGHDHGEYDPHFWQDPARMADLADAVATELGEVDPENAETYDENAAALRADLETLDEEYATGLEGCEIDVLVTNHEAFGYLEKYGLHVEAITGITPEAEPTPAVLADLQDLIAEEGITTVFSETLVSADTAESLADDAGVQAEVLDTVEGLTDETADDDYLSLMRDNLTKIKDANRC